MTELSEAEKVAKIAKFGLDKPALRRTKRRYAHELYPHAAEGERRPLSVEVPYLYARAVGMDVNGTGWFDTDDHVLRDNRTMLMIEANHKALIADALLQDMVGDEAWQWADERMDESGELVWERAGHYGIPMDDIKPYPCGPARAFHDHLAEPDRRGWRTVTRVPGTEDDCFECTEEVSL